MQACPALYDSLSLTQHSSILLTNRAFVPGCSEGASHYFGKEIGPLSELHHGVRGRVYAIDSRTLYLHDFHYDGEGPSEYLQFLLTSKRYQNHSLSQSSHVRRWDYENRPEKARSNLFFSMILFTNEC